MIHILICDNNPVQASALQQTVAELLAEKCTFTICHSGAELRAACTQKMPQVALMDILIGEESGIALSQELFPKSSGTAVIFITGYTEYCTEVYEAEHVYFLSKPIQTAQLHAALEKAVDASRQARPIFTVHVDHKLHRVDLKDVLSIESFYRKLRIRFWNESLECYGSIRDLPELVLRGMIQCHKSFLVNPEYIRSVDRAVFVLMNGATVPISRNRYEDSRRAFLDYCAERLGGGQL